MPRYAVWSGKTGFFVFHTLSIGVFLGGLLANQHSANPVDA